MGSPPATISSDPGLTAAFATAAAGGRAALIPYFTAGYPTPGLCLEALRAADAEADILEVGVPFSDPLADGPVIQRSSFEARRQGMTLERTLDLVHRAALRCPVVLFSYLNPILQYGPARFLADAAAAGASGVLLTDLPAGADPDLEAMLGGGPLDLVRLVAPTTSPARLAATAAGARGFLYVIGRLGVTGASTAAGAGLPALVHRVREASPLPVAVGFGISTPAQAAGIAAFADGVVVGSALVDCLGRDGLAAALGLLGAFRRATARGGQGSP